VEDLVVSEGRGVRWRVALSVVYWLAATKISFDLFDLSVAFAISLTAVVVTLAVASVGERNFGWGKAPNAEPVEQRSWLDGLTILGSCLIFVALLACGGLAFGHPAPVAWIIASAILVHIFVRLSVRFFGRRRQG